MSTSTSLTFYSEQYDIDALRNWNGPGKDSIYMCQHFSPPYVEITVPFSTIGMLLTFAQSYVLPAHRKTATPYWEVYFSNTYKDIDERFREPAVAFREADNGGTFLVLPFIGG